MAIRTVVTRGYGNGTFNGTIALVTLRGYIAGVVAVPTVPGLEYTLKEQLLHCTLEDSLLNYTINIDLQHYTMRNK